MYEPKIILEGAKNARDLGGIEIGSRKFKHGRVIRSGMLARISDRDIEYLQSVGLRTVVDFRTKAERCQKPDKIVPGADYVNCMLLRDQTDGVTRDKPETLEEEAQRTVAMARRLMAHDPDGRAQMRSLYPILVTDENAVSNYRFFFELLLAHEEGALLYHCTMGKDRVGIATALLLSALGADRETIMRDYMITAQRCAEGTKALIERCRSITEDEAELEFIYHLDTVEEGFLTTMFETLDERYGGTEAFLTNQMGLDDSKRERLRYLYLE